MGLVALRSRRGLTPRGSLECNPEIPAFPGEEYEGCEGHLTSGFLYLGWSQLSVCRGWGWGENEVALRDEVQCCMCPLIVR